MLEGIFRNLNCEGRGIKINDCWLSNLRFTDDIVLTSGDIKDLKQMVKDLCKERKRLGLSVNISKTKLMTDGNIDEFVVNGCKIDRFFKYKYVPRIDASV